MEWEDLTSDKKEDMRKDMNKMVRQNCYEVLWFKNSYVP